MHTQVEVMSYIEIKNRSYKISMEKVQKKY